MCDTHESRETGTRSWSDTRQSARGNCLSRRSLA